MLGKEFILKLFINKTKKMKKGLLLMIALGAIMFSCTSVDVEPQVTEEVTIDSVEVEVVTVENTVVTDTAVITK